MFLVEDHWQLSQVHTGFLCPALDTYKQPRHSQFQRMKCSPTHFREVVTRRLLPIRSLEFQGQVPTGHGCRLPTAGSSICIPRQFRTPLPCVVHQIRVSTSTCFPNLALRWRTSWQKCCTFQFQMERAARSRVRRVGAEDSIVAMLPAPVT